MVKICWLSFWTTLYDKAIVPACLRELFGIVASGLCSPVGEFERIGSV